MRFHLAETEGGYVAGQRHGSGEMDAGIEKNGVIVVGIDGSKSSLEALRWAAAQARLTCASLQVVAAWHFPASLGWAPAWGPGWDPAAEAAEALEKVVESVLGSHHQGAIGDS